MGIPPQEVSIVIATDKMIHELNKHYRGVDSATDVLAFSMQEGEYGYINPDLLGDVVISIESAQRQAREAGHPLAQELAILLIHGLLHLVGFEHKEKEKARLMEEKSREIWQQIQLDLVNNAC